MTTPDSTTSVRPEVSDRPTGPYLHAHRSGRVMWIDMMWVPSATRRHGEGTRLYRAWERALPPGITQVRLMAADTGSGPANGFWESLGFGYVYEAEGADDLNDEAKHLMVRGVNGHPTPKPQWVTAGE